MVVMSEADSNRHQEFPVMFTNYHRFHQVFYSACGLMQSSDWWLLFSSANQVTACAFNDKILCIQGKAFNLAVALICYIP